MAPQGTSDCDVPPRVQCLSDFANSDLTAARKEFFFRTPLLVTALLPLLKSARDEAILCLMLNIFEVVFPSAALVYWIGTTTTSPLLQNAVGLAHVVALFVLFEARFILMLHFSSHRPVFRHELLNAVPSSLLAPFFGVPPGIYKLHHTIMHHSENNTGLDISSTEPYQRDSPLALLQYWFHFALLIGFELPCYALHAKRYKWLFRSLSTLLLYFGGMYVLMARVSMVATVWVFLVPHLLTLTAMALGNFGQHIFVNPDAPDSNYGLTYNCIDVPQNQMCFNDGYHVVHHNMPRLHWSEIPGYFMERQEKHLQEGAMTFRGVFFDGVAFLVLTGRVRKLAERYVHLGSRETAPTVDEVEQRLRAWLKPVPARSKKKAA
eukprot:NODE_609_length_1447_cov_367.848420.p1 GENE.NODE_609_length_1447_cov_367.848420~~NODE_609_length_1447_cov_367.848420.p1  ORF type:complete len:378 (-),score=114.83 NODE_609_length_1447_cov_367.848420:170-1303(-)